MSKHALTTAITAVVACAAASAVLAAQTGANVDAEPRVLKLASPQGDRAALRMTVGDPDGQVLAIRLGGAVVAIADGTGCGPRNGQPGEWVLPVRRLEPGVHALQVFLTSSACTSNATLQEARSDFAVTVADDGSATVAGQFGEPFAPPRCRTQRIPGEEQAGIRKATPPIVIGCVRLRQSGRRYELIAYQQTRIAGGSALYRHLRPGDRFGLRLWKGPRAARRKARRERNFVCDSHRANDGQRRHDRRRRTRDDQLPPPGSSGHAHSDARARTRCGPAATAEGAARIRSLPRRGSAQRPAAASARLRRGWTNARNGHVARSAPSVGIAHSDAVT